MTTYDDGTPVQPGDYVMTVPVKVDGFGDVLNVRGLPLGSTLTGGLLQEATFAPVAKPRPPLPTQLGAVVWASSKPFLLGQGEASNAAGWRSTWRDSWGLVVDTAWLARQDWTTTPPEAS